jgi:D-arginine dehydrogenase
VSGVRGYSPKDRSRGCVVVGGGIAGVSVAAELAREGDVLLVEGEAELARHTTGGSAASYIPGHGTAPARALVSASRARFDALAEEAGHAFLRPRPVLHVAHDADEERVLREEVLPLDTVDELTVDEAVAHWPALRPEGLRGAGLVPDAQDADPIGLHQHFRRALRDRCGAIRTGTPVTSLAPTRTGWRVGLGDEHVDADLVVLAAGAWTDRLLALAGAAPLGLRPLRRTIAIARVPDGAPVRRDDPFVVSAGERWYAKPEGEHLLVSPSEETPDDPGDPRPDELDVASALERVNAVTTLGLRSVVTSWTGLRTFAPDRALVVGDRPDHRGLHLFAGQGGSGIETAPAAAALAAAVIRGQDPPADVATALAEHGVDVGAVLARRLPAPGEPADPPR